MRYIKQDRDKDRLGPENWVFCMIWAYHLTRLFGSEEEQVVETV